MHFCCSELIVVTLIKQTNTTFVNLRGAFICFILCDTILNWKVFLRFENIILIEQPWDCYQLTSLISSFFRSLVNTGRPLSHFWILIANKGEGASQIFLKILPKKILSNQKVRCTRTRHCYAMPILLCFSDVFLHFKNVFISHVWEVNNCTA